MAFSDFVGNEQIVHTLSQAAAGGRLSHAYLLYGAAGTGKRTLAALFARALFCSGDGERPCGKCTACYKLARGIHPDCIIIRPSAGKTLIPVETIRSMREELYIRPNESEYKLIIMEQSDCMNASAANALLKVLEEPPPYAVFLLLAESRGTLPETIASRCICLELLEPTEAQAKDWLLSHCPDHSAEECAAALRYSGGNLGESLRYLTEEPVREQAMRAFALAQALVSYREFDLLAALAPIEGDREQFICLLTDFDRLIGQIMLSPYRQPADEQLLALSKVITSRRACAIHELIAKCSRRLRLNGSMSLLPSLFSAELKTAMEQ
jgi:DNA polymerase-3 subunit delta'